MLAVLPADAQTIVHLRPRQVVSTPALAAVLAPFVSEGGREQLDRLFGLHLDEIDELVWASFPDVPDVPAEAQEERYILLLRARRPMRDVARAVGMRMNTVEVSADTPFVRRVGFLGTKRREVVALTDDVLLYAAGSGPTVAEIVALARGEETASIAPRLAPDRVDSPLAIYHPWSLGFAADSGPGLLLSEQERLAASVSARDDESLAVALSLPGTFPAGAEVNFAQWFQSVAASDLGRAIGMDVAASSLEVSVTERGASLTCQWPTASLVQGIRTLFTDDLRQLIDDHM